MAGSNEIASPPVPCISYGLIYDTLRRVGTPIPTNDLWIAATAMRFGLIMVTVDSHYDRVGQIEVQMHSP